MRKMTLVYASMALLLVVGAGASIAAAAPQPNPRSAETKTLTFDIQFSPLFVLDLGQPGLSLGDETIFHDQLFDHGRQVGDEGGSCVVVDVSQALLNCQNSIRLPGGEITGQGLNTPAPQKLFALTGGTGVYQGVAGEGTVIEFGNGRGSLTFHLTERREAM